jgi:hypothetical protein
MDVCVEIVIPSEKNLRQVSPYRKPDAQDPYIRYGNYIQLLLVNLPRHLQERARVDIVMQDYQAYSISHDSIAKLEAEVNGYPVDWGDLSLEQFLKQIFKSSKKGLFVFELYCDTIDNVYHISDIDELIDKIKQSLRFDTKKEGFIVVFNGET